MARTKPEGWRNKRPDDPFRHAQAAKGIKSHVLNALEGVGWEQQSMTQTGGKAIEAALLAADHELDELLEALETDHGTGINPVTLEQSESGLTGPPGYMYYMSRGTKSMARAEAAQLRKEGWLARVVPSGVPSMPWAVYRRPERTRRGE